MMQTIWNPCGHVYSLASVGLKRDVHKMFLRRADANEAMYKIIAKNNLSIEKIWNDNHDKTYNCSNGVKFFIQRA